MDLGDLMNLDRLHETIHTLAVDFMSESWSLEVEGRRHFQALYYRYPW